MLCKPLVQAGESDCSGLPGLNHVTDNEAVRALAKKGVAMDMLPEESRLT